VVHLIFTTNGQQILEMTLHQGEQAKMDGDASWLDFGYEPYSDRLGRQVSFEEDPEEWGRSLAVAYAGTPTSVEVVKDTGAAAAVPTPEPPAAAPPRATSSTIVSEIEATAEREAKIARQAKRFRQFKIVAGILIVVAVVYLLGGPSLLHSKGPEPRAVLTMMSQGLASPKADRYHYEIKTDVSVSIDTSSIMSSGGNELAALAKIGEGGTIEALGNVAPAYFDTSVHIEGPSLKYDGVFVISGGSAHVKVYDEWYQMPLPANFAAEAKTKTQPLANAAALAPYLDVESFSGPTIDGEKTWQLKGTIDGEKLTKDAAKVSGSVPVELLGLESMLKDTTFELIVGQDDGLPRRFWLRIEGNPADWSESADGSELNGEVMINIDANFSKWGVQAKPISVPHGGKPIAALFKMLDLPISGSAIPGASPTAPAPPVAP